MAISFPADHCRPFTQQLPKLWRKTAPENKVRPLVTTSLPKSAKLLAWFAIVNGALTGATPFLLPLLADQSLPVGAIALFLILGISSFVAGFYGSRARPWAFWLLFAVFLVQACEYLSEGFSFSFVGPLSLRLGWGWHSPPSRFNLNILAVAICYFAALVAARLGAAAGEGSQNASSSNPMA